MIFISSGHNPKGIKPDPGAIGCRNLHEADLALQQKNLVIKNLNEFEADFITDYDDERLSDYLTRIQTGDGSVVLEIHFDAFNGKASGTTGIVGTDADRLDWLFMKEVVGTTASILQIPNRGVKTEKEAHRGRLGLMREKGIVGLIEVCFIDNCSDIDKWEEKKHLLGVAYARLLKRYDDIIK